MDRIHSVGIVGAGALGMLYAAALADAPETEVFFVADGDRANRLGREGVVVNGKPRTIPVKTPADLGRAGDEARAGDDGDAPRTPAAPHLLIIAVKTLHLADITPLLHAAAGPQTIILSVLNGVESEPFLDETCPASTVLRCVAVGMDAVREQNRLSFSTPGKLLIGTADNDAESPALKAACEVLDRAGLAHETPADINRELWWKLMVNIGMNQVSAVTGAPYGSFQRNPETQALMEAAMNETVAVAQAAGVNLRDDDVDAWYTILNRLGPDGKTSMLQDTLAGRPTEVESFGGHLISVARERGIPVPVNETLVHIIRVRESLTQRL